MKVDQALFLGQDRLLVLHMGVLLHVIEITERIVLEVGVEVKVENVIVDMNDAGDRQEGEGNVAGVR